ncbi:TPM domain-containing protein [Blastomonas sp.]|uniref:TPM domain-containing protein n=1 Tax=Blastomonas sp. TaxID=1909299 RepID=UPI002602F93D|nr:TPM domain-containing protein [Blastomonas sp.]MDM7957913.1 TPM domain-containing protein [Blastomonas sp.]
MLALLCIAAASSAPALAQTYPKLTGRVVDSANLLNPAQEAALTAKLEALEKQSTRQVVVVTLPDLQGYEIEEYGYQLGREWGIGQAANGDAEKDNGALLIVAPTERKVRIEVGYGLEGILTDALSSVIIQQDILPRFRDNDYPGGIAAGTDAIVTQLTLPDDEARAFASEVEQEARASKGGGGIGLFLFWGAIILFFFIIPALSSAGKGRRYGRSGVGDVVTWGLLLGQAMNNGRGGGGGGFGGGGFGGGGFGGGGGGFGGGGSSGGW